MDDDTLCAKANAAIDDEIARYCEMHEYEGPLGAVCPLPGETPLRLTGNGFVDAPTLRVRFSRAEPAQSVEVAATVAEDGAIQCASPLFEGATEPFDTTVQVSLDGQHYAETGGGTFRYEGGGGKPKKK